ncbi:TetR/AcrR family transcriptional regulator [Streptomyces telluris]|uniref:TetR/AcrR family transcriptional regulator n=1 Tax=Streptomyces telluris TaxID=2720021 RepID=A0A9X2RJT1_9ACTN|nr:TetR/AcrR family transcriptional regulator [Streptomyces telluris]MCQ8769063.1 TetR/AcrR family transcriptional regulator [Streptomyces telluris]NJP80270.1 TetR/AcrR family transcriptional regulator [Streptomyces telluris]
MTPTSAERGQETRARLLGAAARLVVDEGWGAVTTRKVAAAAGLRPGLVHYHFDTVTDLLVEASLEASRREIDKVIALLEQAAEGPAGTPEALAALAEYPSDASTAVLAGEMVLAATRNKKMRDGLAELTGRWRTAVAAWLRAHGNTADPEGTALVLGAAVDGLLLQRLIEPALAAVPLDGPLARLTGITCTTETPEHADGSEGSDGSDTT